MFLSSKEDVMLEIQWRAGVIHDKVVRVQVVLIRSKELQGFQTAESAEAHSIVNILPIRFGYYVYACVFACMTEGGVVIHSSGAT